MKKHYTIQELGCVIKAYEANFDKLMASVGTPKHTIYLKEESRLNNLSKVMKADIGTEELIKHAKELNNASKS